MYAIKEDLAKLEGKLVCAISDSKAELVKWMFIFIIELLFSLAGLMIGLFSVFMK